MSTLTGTLNIAKTALLAAQKAIGVVSHNIANADTEGYSRQRVSFLSLDTINVGGLLFGTGVEVSSVKRVYDAFQQAQLIDSYSQYARYQYKEATLNQIEYLLNDLGGTGLLDEIDGLFAAFGDLSNNPSSYAERAVVLSRGEMLADSFGNVDTNIRNDLVAINKQMEALVIEVNTLASQLASLNYEIAIKEAGGYNADANDLRDQRDMVINNIARIIDINTLENDMGQIDVYLSGGAFLVTGVEVGILELTTNDDYPIGYDLVSHGTVMNDKITGGALKGLIEAADYNREVLGKLDLLAATMVRDLNVQNQAGYGLDSTTGNDFFSAPGVYTRANTANSGGAQVTAATVTTLASLTFNNYEIRFADASNYVVVNTTTNSVVTTGAYTSGNAIIFDGMSVTVTDSTGTPLEGDVYTVSSTKDAARNIGMGITDTDKIAASATLAGLPGDNVNALALAALKDFSALGVNTYSEYYAQIVSDIGIELNTAASNAEARERIVQQMEMTRASISGVSMEEEAVELIKLQRAYEAAAQLMRTVDEMYETLLNIR
jgi:flagellar hook-associated protein 1 FlgK